MSQLEFTLPTPPSANVLWRNAKGKTIKNKKVAEYMQNAGWRILEQLGAQTVGEFCEGREPLSVTLKWYRGRASGDLDNRIKCVLDAMQGVVYEDDKRIVHIEAFRFEDKKNPRLEVVVREWVA